MAEATLTPENGDMSALAAEAVAARRRRRVNLGGTAIALLGLLALWIALSILVRPWVPTPMATLFAMGDALASAGFYADMALTLGRVLVAFTAASVVGCALGIAVGLSRRTEAFFQPLLAVGLAIPDPVYIIFAILALGTGELAGVVALTVALVPFVSNIVRSSVHARDLDLDEMVKVYRFSRWEAFRSNLVPQLIPAFLTAARFSFALSWKLVVVVEALSQPDGIGAAIFQAFNVLRMREMLALAILFTLVMQLLERGVIQRLEQRLLQWRL